MQMSTKYGVHLCILIPNISALCGICAKIANTFALHSKKKTFLKLIQIDQTFYLGVLHSHVLDCTLPYACTFYTFSMCHLFRKVHMMNLLQC